MIDMRVYKWIGVVTLQTTIAKFIYTNQFLVGFAKFESCETFYILRIFPLSVCVTIHTVLQVKKVQADRAVVFQDNENQARE